MNKPSSTIQAATLAGLAMAVVWQVLAEFFGVTASELLVSSSTALASGVVGYFWPERVYPEGWKDGPG